MQNKSRLSFINSKKLHRSIFSSYDNDTFVPDQEFEIVSRKASSLDDIIAEKEDVEVKECGCTVDIINDTEKIVSVSKNGCSEHKSCEIDKISKTSETVKDINNTQHTPPNGVTSDTVRKKDNEDDTAEGKATTPNDIDLSDDKDDEQRQKMLRKPRSFSDTQDPILCHHLSTTYCEMNESRKESNRQKNEEVKSTVKKDDTFDTGDSAAQAPAEPVDKTKRNKRWIRKLARYATFDEGSVYLAKASKSPIENLSKETISQEGEEEEDSPLNGENSSKENNFQRRISTGKLIRQSMSNGFSKFKQLSISGKTSRSKIDQDYSMINNDLYGHETSKRIVPLEPDELMPALLNVHSPMEGSNLLAYQGNLLRRCSSLPDCLDATSICDNELDELYLPRRMAICPDLAVPAMKQLRTYLVLSRLKQYCIV